MHKFLKMAAVAAAALVAGPVAAQDDWPNQPISLIVPFAAGGGSDTVARAAAPILSRELGVPVNVVNRTGAGGLTGATAIKEADPDGYTIGLGATNLNVHGWQQPGSVTPTDLEPIALLNTNVAAFQVSADSPFQTLGEAMEAFKANPTNFTSSASGVGGVWHVGLLKLAMSQGIAPEDVIFVPSGGAGPSLAELIAGGVDFAPTSIAEAAAQIKAGQVRSLGVMAEERLEAFPDVPTVEEELGTRVVHTSWTGLVAPKGTPEPVLAKLRDAARVTWNSPEFRSTLETLGFGLSYAEGPDFAAFMAEQYDSSGVALKAAGLID